MTPSSASLLVLATNELQVSRLKKALNPEGYQLSILAGLDHSLSVYTGNPPDLAILWLSDPFPEALSHLKKLIDQINRTGNGDSIPVLVIIDQYETRWVEPVFRLGVTDILTRPIHPLVLRQRVRLLLQARQTQRAVTRYQKSELALQEEKERFRTVADFTYDWEYWSGLDGRLIYNSPSSERITGYSPQAFLENPDLLTQIVVSEDREMFQNHQRNELLSEDTYEIDFQILTKTGEKRWIGHLCQQVHSNDGRVLGRRVSNRDITERKLVEHTLVRSERLAAIGRLTASLSHEINNPLQAIFSSIELLQGFHLEEEERQQYLQIIHLEIERLMRINSEILDFSRESDFTLHQTTIQHVIEHSLFLANTQLRHSGILVKKEIPENLPQLLASPDQLAQVFLNLIINAAENMPEGGELQISVEANQNQVEISFKDTGSGISADDLELIFEPFYTTKNRGTGLGLSISQKIVQRHRGTITAQSAPGNGSIFTVSFPIQPVSPHEDSQNL